jgi:hypothetical protein
MSWKKAFSVFFIGCIALISIILIWKNCNTNDFYEANLLQILTFILATMISFSFVQHRTDKRRKVDCIEHIIIEIQNLINNNEILFSLEREALILQSSIANKIKYLKEKGFSQTTPDIDYISSEFEELRSLYANHKQSTQDLDTIKEDLNRHKINISTKCDKVRLTLYEL